MAQNEEHTEVDETSADELENAVNTSETETSDASESNTSKAGTTAESTSDDERDPEDVSLEEVQNILNKEANDRDLPKNVQKLLAREEESSKRVEEAVKGTKSNPRWFVPVFSLLLVLGLAWVVVNYITGGTYPIPGLGNWNLLIGFGIMMVGFLMTMWWN
jgi:cobalamin biosynthesis Mg chelatase CobN